jgi:hypothetical protein
VKHSNRDERSRAPVVLMGPQRHDPTVRAAVDDLVGPELDRPVAAVTAGWEEREAEDLELGEHLEREIVNLDTFARVEDLLQTDDQLLTAWRRRVDRRHELRHLYQIRLGHALDAARELLRHPDDSNLLESERAHAIDAVRAIDAQHLARMRDCDRDFEALWTPGKNPAIDRHRRELAELTKDVAAFCVAGGNVRVLLDRMRLLDVPALFAGRPLVAWSAGAMALTDRVVLFHDCPPQGRGNPEVLNAGLGLAPGVVVLPHARARLLLDDPVRVGLFARRFQSVRCITLDAGARLDLADETWAGDGTARVLTPDGPLAEVGA